MNKRIQAKINNILESKSKLCTPRMCVVASRRIKNCIHKWVGGDDDYYCKNCDYPYNADLGKLFFTDRRGWNKRFLRTIKPILKICDLR
jgi:hypothetical protein